MTASLPPEVRKSLEDLHEEIMWLARRRTVTPSMARAWYTHVVAERLKRQLRVFSGKVSRLATRDPQAELRLEHHGRIQTRLTALVEEHLKLKRADPESFIRTLVELENVHIVTRAENYVAMKADGDYKKAGIVLVPWHKISKATRRVLWKRMLRGKVSNAKDFSVETVTGRGDR